MILLDTNILSELMRPAPSPAVEQWLGRLTDTPLATTAITVAEIAYGLERLEDGNRKQDLWARFDQFIDPTSDLAIFPFDEDAALVCGQYRALRESQGQHAHASDMMIAGIAGAIGADLATRNVKDFTGLPIGIINPWGG
ncbi:MAG: VapC toxin family PIN domain ribonuclease [Hirschia sp.]|nr:VapC toxin family PIN domain ribonuclease [Hirschia sp.]MBF17057.1 VapC toxin family PIN domain ribonuclease [Hirschia sp.]|tara:strand:+ start:990 stop:1409 length:420 start_codon:yes stop_codon:yes gene_type:complete